MARRVIGRRVLSWLFVVALVLPFMNVRGSEAAARPKLSAKNVTLKAGKKITLKVRNVKKKKIKSIRFTSNKKKIAKVSAKGKVTAQKIGTAKITCRVTLKNNKRYKLVCKVKVIKANKTSGSGENVSVKDPDAGTGVTARPDNTADPQNPSKDPDSTADPQNPSKDPDSTADPQNPSKDPNSTADPQNPSKDPDSTADPQNPSKDPNSTADPQNPSKDPDNTTEPQQPTQTPNPLIIPTVKPGTMETVDDGQMREDMTAFDIQHEMGMGINLGNTFESCGGWISSSSVTNYETAWRSPVIAREMISGMRQAGFRSIRIPVSWSNMIAADGSYAISNAYMDRVEEVMNYAFDAEMYVIINIHYDSGWWARFGSKDAQERAEAMNRYISMWTQLANRFERYSDHLIFESANEELGHRLNSTDDYVNSGYYTGENDLYQLTNNINQTFVNVVRGTGGNNASRYLLIAGYDTDIAKTCDPRFQMPSDTITDRLMISIHYYDPSAYCLAEDVNNSWGYQDTWGTDADIAAMKSTLNDMRLCFVDKGIPVVIGEYGGECLTKTNTGYVKKTGRTLFYQTLCEYALTHGMCPVLWDVHIAEDPSVGVYNRLTCRITDPEEAEMFLKMEEYGENAAVYESPAASGAYIWNGTISCKGWNPGNPISELENSNIIMNREGGCYKIIGIDWSGFSHPMIKMHADFTGGSANCYFGKEDYINKDNPYNHYIEESLALKGNWTFSRDVTYDLSSLQLTGMEALYLCVKSGTDFEGQVTLTIMEKE